MTRTDGLWDYGDETPREHFERLMAEGEIEEAERFLDALEMFAALDKERM